MTTIVRIPKEQLEQFAMWIESGSASRCPDGTWVTQEQLYAVRLSFEELISFFLKEYCND